MIQEHIKKPLAEELLFGKLAKGGNVRVKVEGGKLAFDYPHAAGHAARAEGSGAGGVAPPDIGMAKGRVERPALFRGRRQFAR